jgi:hypothetical protein
MPQAMMMMIICPQWQWQTEKKRKKAMYLRVHHHQGQLWAVLKAVVFLKIVFGTR